MGLGPPGPDGDSRVVDGWVFNADFAGSVSSGSTYTMLQKTGARYAVVSQEEYAVNAAPVTITMYESPTVTANGTVIPTYNMNRNSANVATTALYDSPTVTANGTQVMMVKSLATSGGGPANQGTPLNMPAIKQLRILKPHTLYLIAIVNNSSSTLDFVRNAVWYELLQAEY